VLNIAEGTGRLSKADKKKFYIIARSSIFECMAIFDVLKDEKAMHEMQFQYFYNKAEELSKKVTSYRLS
jgi:four helix bundle protein